MFLRKISRLVSLGLASSLVFNCLPASAESTASDLKAGQLQEVTLQNGLKVLLLEEHSFPVFSSMVFYRVGSRNENLGESGLSHLLEHMLFQKVGKYRKGEIGATIARNGGMFNGFTSDDFTVFFETMAPSKLELAMKIESARMHGGVFTQEEVTSEIKQIEKELEQEAKDQANILVKEVRSAAFTRHPYKNPAIGWSTDVQKLTLDDVKRQYKQYYQPGNATLVIVGDFNSANALSLVHKYFDGVTAGTLPPPVRVVEPPQRAEKRIYMKQSSNADVVALAYHAPGFNNADTAALAVLEKVLLSGMGGRLKNKLSEQKICSNVKSAFEVKHDPSLFTVNMTTVPGVNASKALEAFDATIEQLKSGTVSDVELRRARNHAELNLLTERDGPYRTAFHLGFFDSLDSWQSAYAWLNKLRAVNAGDVQRVAKLYFATENRVVGILNGTNNKPQAPAKPGPKPGSKNEGEKTDDKTKTDKNDKSDKSKESTADKSKDKGKDKSKDKAKDKSKDKSTKNSKHTALALPVQLAAYDGAARANPTYVAQGQTDSSTNTNTNVSAASVAQAPAPVRNAIKKAVLKNGVTIAVLESKVSPVVQIVGAVKAGEAYEPVGKRGVSSLLAKLMNESSTRLNRLQMQASQDEMGIAPASMIKFESGPQWISFQARCLSRDTGAILNMLGGQLREPLIKDENVEQAKGQLVDRIKHVEDTVKNRVDRALLQGLIAPNTSFYPLEPQDKARFISNLKTQDAADFHKMAVCPDATTIVFVGDISLEQATSLTQSVMDSWSGKSTAKRVSVQANPKRLVKNTILIDKPQNTIVSIGKLVDTTIGAEDYPLLLLGDCALTSHPIFSRFAQKISKDSKDTAMQSTLSLEDLSSDVESMPGSTVWTLDVPVSAQLLPAVVKSIQSELRKFSRQGLTPEEYAEVRLYMNSALPVRWMSNAQLSARSILESMVLEGKGDPLPVIYAGFKSASLDKLNRYIQTTFNPEKASLVIAGTKQSAGQVHGTSTSGSANTAPSSTGSTAR